MTILFIALAFLGGMAIAFQVGLNSELGTFLGHPLQASIVFFAIGTIALTIYSFTLDLSWPTGNSLTNIPWWAWLGGILGGFYVYITVFLAPKLGGAVVIGLAITGQVIASLILDHYGLFGFPKNPINLWRIIGSACLILGIVLIKAN